MRDPRTYSRLRSCSTNFVGAALRGRPLRCRVTVTETHAGAATEGRPYNLVASAFALFLSAFVLAYAVTVLVTSRELGPVNFSKVSKP